jgi:hypothetical protein
LQKPDLIIIDPLFAFAGFDLIDTPKVSAFLRDGLIPLAVRNHVGVHVVHHIGKPSRDNKAKTSWSEVDFQYLGFGSSEIQNAFRAVNILLPVSGEDRVFRLILSKRGCRAGALDMEGERTTSLYLAQSDSGIFWSQVEKPAQSGAATRFKAEYCLEEVLEGMSFTEGERTSDIQKRVTEETGMSRRKFYGLWKELKSKEKIKVDKDGLWTKR